MKNILKVIMALLCLILCNSTITVSTLFAETNKADHPPGITNILGMEFVYIKPGKFIMGVPEGDPNHIGDEKPISVTFSEGFYMQTTEVTQGQWTNVMGRNPSDFKNCGADCPVETVSWNDVQLFIKILNFKDKTGKYRLPYEAEWEYACRAGTTTPFSFGTCITSDQVNYCGKLPLPGCHESAFFKKTTPVASYPPNQWGLYDMHGNVEEWCEDWYFVNFIYTPKKYPIQNLYQVMPKEFRYKVVRGGYYGSEALYSRSANRFRHGPIVKYSDTGFRLVLTP